MHLVILCTYFIKQACQHFHGSNSVTAIGREAKTHLWHSYRAFRKKQRGSSRIEYHTRIQLLLVKRM